MASQLPNKGKKLRLSEVESHTKGLIGKSNYHTANFIGSNVTKIINRNDLMSSELPADIISFIVSHLTLRDVVKTSILSHRWRRIFCAYICRLKFDWHNLFHEGLHAGPCKQYTDKFARAVNQFLQFSDQAGTRIGAFHLNFCVGRDYSKDIDQWITSAIKMGAESITLHLDCGRACYRVYFHYHKEEIYVFRPELLSFNLKQLELGNCCLGPNCFSKFSNLGTLKLVEVPLGLSEMQTIFSCCLSLFDLSLEKCTLSLNLRILGSLPRLRSLKICECNGVNQIELSAMNLVRFEHSSYFLVKHSFLGVGVPKLEEAYFTVGPDGDVQDIFHLAEDLPNLRVLYVLDNGDSVCIPKSITIFSKVEMLELNFPLEIKFDFLEMIAILRAFPLLQKFYLATRCPRNFEQGGNLEPNKHVHQYLKEVHLAGFYGTSSQIKFAIYLLKNAPALKLLVIDPKGNFRISHHPCWWPGTKPFGHRLSWDEGEPENVCEKLQEFSKDVVLIIK